MEYLSIAFKTITIMAILLILTLITGRRKIAELPVFDFLALLVVSAITGAYIADLKVGFRATTFTLGIVVLMQYIYSFIILKSRKIEGLVSFEPVVVIENGQFVKANLKKIKYTIENVLMLLREKDVFDVGEVEFAIIESNGKISVLKKSQFQPITPKEIKMNTGYRGLSIPLIVEGEVYKDNLNKLNLDGEWLNAQLKSKNIISVSEVFYAAINTEGNLYISKGLSGNSDMHNLKH